MEDKTCYIFAGGPEIGRVLAAGSGYTIAADSGFLLCKRVGMLPDLVIGDFDSLGFLPDEGAYDMRRVVLPEDKDETDTLAAVKAGLDEGCTRFLIYGALGGDLGHTLANIQTLDYLRDQGANGMLHGNGQELYLVTAEDGTRTFKGEASSRVSLFAYGGPCEGITTQGLKWELSGEGLDPLYPRGVSNEAAVMEFSVEIASGKLLVVLGG